MKLKERKILKEEMMVKEERISKKKKNPMVVVVVLVVSSLGGYQHSKQTCRIQEFTKFLTFIFNGEHFPLGKFK